MKQTIHYPIFALLLIFFVSCQPEKKSNLTLLSDQIPTETALIFGEGVVSTGDFEFAITFSPEMDEMFFTRRKPEDNNEIFTMKLENGQWSKPEPAFFSTDAGWDFEPHIDPTGNLLYFGTTRPLKDTTKASGMHQWYSTKTAKGWSAPEPLGSPFVDRVVMYLTASENGNLYFTSGEEDDKPEDWVIYSSDKEANGYGNAKTMATDINFSGKWIAHSYIAPDESYMIYDGESEDGFGDCDLYISFNQNGTWTEPYNMGPEVNTEHCEMTASVSPDGRYLFFHRGISGDDEEVEIGNIYWIDFVQLKEKILRKMGN
jgi:hypothetical protein